MEYSDYTVAERRFRIWMLISAYMYSISGLFFLIAGMHIAPFINTIADKLFPALQPYPLPDASPEGKFWLVLSLSMMAMITWICRAAYLDLRNNGRLVHVLLLSKFCSTVFYLYFFFSTGQAVHIVGALTDGPLFLVTLALWIPAAPANRIMDETEENILVSIGEGVVPRDGAFKIGYADHMERCLYDARRILSAQDPATRVSLRLLIRMVDIMPLLFGFGLKTCRRLPAEKRTEYLEKLENCRISVPRNILMAVKIVVLLPFFNSAETSRAVGYDTAEVSS